LATAYKIRAVHGIPLAFSRENIYSEKKVMPMLHLAVCDDEPYMRNEICALVAAYMEEKGLPCEIDGFPGGRELLACEKAYDLLFLDIRMEPDGLETARQMRERGFAGLLVFLTVLKESVFDAFAVQPFDYLLKPLCPERLRQTLDRAAALWERSAAGKLPVQRNGAYRIVPFSCILYCEVLGRKIFLHQTDGEILDYYEKMENLTKRVDSRFFRCHRSYLVNLDYVRGCTGETALLPGDVRLPVSRSRQKAFVRALLLRMKEEQNGCL